MSVLTNETIPARCLRFLSLASIPLSAALSVLSLFVPLNAPAIYCVPSALFASLFCHIIQGISVLMTRSVVGLVYLPSISSTVAMAGLELGSFILIILSIYDAVPHFEMDGESVSWSSKLTIPVVVLLSVHIAVLCVNFALMVAVRHVATRNDAGGLPTLRNLGIACALWSWIIFLLSMVGGDFGMTSYLIFPVTAGLSGVYYTVAVILNWLRPRPTLFTSGWAVTLACMVGFAQAAFFCPWLVIIIAEIQDQMDQGIYLNDGMDHASPGALIALSVFVFVNVATLMSLFAGGIVLDRAASCQSMTVDPGRLERSVSVSSESESLKKSKLDDE